MSEVNLTMNMWNLCSKAHMQTIYFDGSSIKTVANGPKSVRGDIVLFLLE